MLVRNIQPVRTCQYKRFSQKGYSSTKYSVKKGTSVYKKIQSVRVFQYSKNKFSKKRQCSKNMLSKTYQCGTDLMAICQA